ncbi:MAG: hypothetical protein H7249_13655 [Chitinophagaceae bacterium]|nr:hypothetical protein [Oligoflexus sp.]
MSAKILVILSISFGLTGCFNLPLTSVGKLATSGAGETRAAAPSSGTTDAKQIANVDSNSTVSVALTTPKVTGLSGASVVIQPGSLGVSASLIVEQAADLGDTTMSAEMGLGGDIHVTQSSPGMIIRPSENVDLKKPLSLAMPLPTSTGFRLAETGSKFAVFYKYFDPTTQALVMGLKLVDGVNVTLGFDEASGKDVIRFNGYFGAYWATILSREIKPAEVPAPKATDEPIINKANVSVIQNSGVVKETEIAVKQAIPEMVWEKTAIKLDAANRIVSISASLPLGRTITACKADLFESTAQATGISLDAPLGPSIDFTVVKKTIHSLTGRFRCVDDQGRQTFTPWSDFVVVPAAPETVASIVVDPNSFNPGVCDDVNPAALFARGYENGVYKEYQPFIRDSKCKYHTDAYVDNAGSLYIQKGDYSYTCGLANHTLGLGTQQIYCHQTTAAAFGGDSMMIPSGGLRVSIDFTNSVAAPILTLAMIPCDQGDFLVSGHPMTHLGACTFVYDATTLPIDASYNLLVQNSSGSYFCGDSMTRSPGGFGLIDSCSVSSHPLRIGPLLTAASHRIRLWLGQAAVSHKKIAGISSVIEYFPTVFCPSNLSLQSSSLGMIASAYKTGVCTYDFRFSTDETDLTRYNFKIVSPDNSRNCGGFSSGLNITPQCDPNSNEIPFPGAFNKFYGLTLVGDPSTGVFATTPLVELTPNCVGNAYLQTGDLSHGYHHLEAQAFQEVKACRYEKIWTPATAGEGFYISKADQRYLCYGQYPYNNPMVGGSFANPMCSSSTANPTPIVPVGVIPGTPYKIIADEQSGLIKVSVAPYIAPVNCPNDLVMIPDAGGEQNFIYQQNCNYTLTLKNASPSAVNYSYLIGNTAHTEMCSVGSVNPNFYPANRSDDMNCLSSGTKFSLTIPGGQTARLTVKRDPTLQHSHLTVQNLKRNYPTVTFDGAYAYDLGGTPLNFMTAAYTAGMDNFQFNWHPTSNIYLGIYRDGDRCGLSSPTPSNNPLNTSQTLVCHVADGTSPVPIGTWSTGSYLVTYSQPWNWEDDSKIVVTSVASAIGTPLLAAASYYGSSLAVGSTPGSVVGASTWTSSDGRMWMFGGIDISGHRNNFVYYFDTGTHNWVQDSGTGTLDESTFISGTLRPSARAYTTSFYDQANNRLYVFGGEGKDTTAATGILGDLWYYEISTKLWVHVSGTTSAFGAGSYGAVSVPAAANSPPVRINASAWSGSGKIYMFGGKGSSGYFNDLWSYDLSTHNWTWMAGAQESINDATNAGFYPSSRSAGVSWTVGSQGYLYGGQDFAGLGRSDMWVINLTTGNWYKVTDSPINLQATSTGILDFANSPGRIGTREGVAWSTPSGAMWMYNFGSYWIFDVPSAKWAVTLTAGDTLSPFLMNPNTVVSTAGNVFSSANRIGAVRDAVTWSGPNGFWIYGGKTYNNTDTWANMWQVNLPPP